LPAQRSSGVARYTIRDGDTIVSLANTFNVSVEAIVEANSTVANGDATLRSGDTIHVPRNAYMTDVPADAFVSAREQPYRVAQDDSVISIAEQFGFLPETLAAYNQWADGLGHVLLVDDEILVPPGGVIVEE
jgi:LysM repeat protein